MPGTNPYAAVRTGLHEAGKRVRWALGEVRAALRHTTYRLEYGRARPSPYRLISVDPADVDHLLAPRFEARLSDHGTYILDGRWDVNTTSEGLMYANIYEDAFEEPTLVRFDRFGFYRSARERFQEGVPWEETEFYRWCLERIEKDAERSPRFRSEEDVRDRLEMFDTLYDEIRTHGYRTQRELQRRGDVPYHKTVWPPERHEVMVSIGRDGDIFFDEGQHRFVIAKLLDLPEIPVRVIVRHREWQRKRAAIASREEALPASAAVEPVDDPDHPDLADLSS